jgi:hypothetical protein
MDGLIYNTESALAQDFNEDEMADLGAVFLFSG